MSRLAIGYVARAHGLRGELRVHTHDPESTTLLDVERVWIGAVEHVVEDARPTNGAVAVAVDVLVEHGHQVRHGTLARQQRWPQREPHLPPVRASAMTDVAAASVAG